MDTVTAILSFISVALNVLESALFFKVKDPSLDYIMIMRFLFIGISGLGFFLLILSTKYTIRIDFLHGNSYSKSGIFRSGKWKKLFMEQLLFFFHPILYLDFRFEV